MPVTERLATCGLPLALSTTETVPFTVPVAVGCAVTVIWQFPPAATEEPQVFVWAKGVAVVIEVMVAGVPPLLLRVMMVPAEVTPTTTLPKFTVCGPSVITAGSKPVPVNAASLGDAGSFDAIERLADCEPEVVGLKKTVIVQLAEVASC